MTLANEFIRKCPICGKIKSVHFEVLYPKGKYNSKAMMCCGQEVPYDSNWHVPYSYITKYTKYYWLIVCKHIGHCIYVIDKEIQNFTISEQEKEHMNTFPYLYKTVRDDYHMGKLVRRGYFSFIVEAENSKKARDVFLRSAFMNEFDIWNEYPPKKYLTEAKEKLENKMVGGNHV